MKPPTKLLSGGITRKRQNRPEHNKHGFPLTTHSQSPSEGSRAQPHVQPGVNGHAGSRQEGIRSTVAHLSRVTLLVLGGVAFAYFARTVVVPVLLAWVLAMVLDTPVRWLIKCHIPRYVSSALIVGIFLLLVSYGVYNLGRPAVDWAKTAPQQLPVLREKFKRFFEPAVHLMTTVSKVGQVAGDATAPKPQPVEIKDYHWAGSMFSWTGSVLGGIAETVVLLFMLLACGDHLMERILQASPMLNDKKKALQMSREIQESISRYLSIVGLINVAFGTLVGVGLHFLGLPNAAMWGGVAAVLNFVPYFGPIAGMLAVGMAGLLAFDTLGRALFPCGIYFLLHLLEADLVTPFLLGRRYALNPVIIFVCLMLCAWLWGVLGALLAVPLLVAAKVICDRLGDLAPLAKVLSS